MNKTLEDGGFIIIDTLAFKNAINDYRKLGEEHPLAMIEKR